MENRQQQILSEIKEMMSSIRIQLEQLDVKMAELQYEVDPQAFAVDSIDLALDEVPALEEFSPVVEEFSPVVEEEVTELDDLPVQDEDLPFVEEQVVDLEPVAEGVMFEPEPLTVQPDPAPIPVERHAVIDMMTARQAWRTDMPGAPVRDVRSAISLNDRVLFINVLFDEDPIAFQETLTAINQMSSLDEVFATLVESHPSWDFESQTVYRFMMAIRRKLN